LYLHSIQNLQKKKKLTLFQTLMVLEFDEIIQKLSLLGVSSREGGRSNYTFQEKKNINFKNHF
jgi:16S rRNA U1498 N3-methylase RsmE